MQKYVMGIEAIMRILPHRYPFLMIDRVLEITSDSILALKNVSIGESHFQGHFPEKPVMPGVLLIEAMAQAAAIHGYAQQDLDPQRQMFVLASVDKAKFRQRVAPGDQLRIAGHFIKRKGDFFLFDTVIHNDASHLVCQARILSALVHVPAQEVSHD